MSLDYFKNPDGRVRARPKTIAGITGEEGLDRADAEVEQPVGVGQSISSVSHSCLTLCDPMDCSTPGLPVHHQLPEFTQTHVHRVGDAIQLPTSPSVVLFSCFQSFPASGFFQWVSSSHQVAKVLVSGSASVLPMNIQN